MHAKCYNLGWGQRNALKTSKTQSLWRYQLEGEFWRAHWWLGKYVGISSFKASNCMRDGSLRTSMLRTNGMLRFNICRRSSSQYSVRTKLKRDKVFIQMLVAKHRSLRVNWNNFPSLKISPISWSKQLKLQRWHVFIGECRSEIVEVNTR